MPLDILGENMELVVIAKIAGVFAYSAFEYWLGKTDKTKAASVVELIINGVKYLVKGKDNGTPKG